MTKPRTRRGAGRPTIADVARRAGVGAITVSRALREPDRVSVELRKQIAAAVEELWEALRRRRAESAGG